MKRIILHSDLNNFYASVECLYRPEIRGKPVAVCGSQEARHGIVLAKNMIAKKKGVLTAETIIEARRKCPNLIIVEPDYRKYIIFSKAARDIYANYTNQIEAFGMDECWLDITESRGIFGDGKTVADEIRKKLYFELGITASIGVSYNKIFAKLGSDMKKPNATTIISKENYRNTAWRLPVSELLFVGRATKRKLNKYAVYTIGDLAGLPLKFLKKQFGKWGETIWSFANGLDISPVVKTDYEIMIKSVGNSLTTLRNLENNDDVKKVIFILCESVGERLREINMKGRTVQISIRDTELAFINRQGKLSESTFLTLEIANKAFEIFRSAWEWGMNIRSMGVRVTDLCIADTFEQISFFMDDKRQNMEKIDKTIDRIRERYGYYSIKRASLTNEKEFSTNPAKANIGMPLSFFK